MAQTVKIGRYGQNQKLIEARHDCGLTRADVAYACNLTTAGLSRVETGQRFSDWSTMYKLSKYYHKSVDDLFFKDLPARAKYHNFYYKIEDNDERQRREIEEAKKHETGHKVFTRKYNVAAK